MPKSLKAKVLYITRVKKIKCYFVINAFRLYSRFSFEFLKTISFFLLFIKKLIRSIEFCIDPHFANVAVMLILIFGFDFVTVMSVIKSYSYDLQCLHNCKITLIRVTYILIFNLLYQIMYLHCGS